MWLIWDCGGGSSDLVLMGAGERVFSNDFVANVQFDSWIYMFLYMYLPFNVLIIMSCTCPLACVYLKIIPYVTKILIRSSPVAVYFLKITKLLY